MSTSSEPCIWMAAGVIAYRLCDRDFDCENCPLDKALQGRRNPGFAASGLTHAHATPIAFPEDRSYFREHFWIRESSRRSRIGIDAFGAQLLGAVSAVAVSGEKRQVQRGEDLLELDLGPGRLALHCPLEGLLHGSNPLLVERPDLLTCDCYHEGWIAELSGDCMPEPGGVQLLDHREIEHCSAHDLKRFRRRVAHCLLADDLGVGPTLADGGALLSDLRVVLGFRRFRQVVAEFLG